jgi:hypothetical protein
MFAALGRDPQEARKPIARIHPAHPDSATPTSERRVFESLRDGLPPEWLVLHARRVVLPALRSHQAFEGEVDFLVLNPDWGWLGLEVKGGSVSRADSGWASTDRDGVAHPISDPGKQAQRAVHAIREYLGSHPQARSWSSRIPFGWGVVFPDLDVRDDLGPDLPRALVVDRSDLQQLRRALERVADVFRTERTSISHEVQRGFLNALVPKIHLVRALADRIDDDQAILVRLTDEQIQILDTLAEITRIAVKGAAGTGKTLVAMEKARRLAEEGKRVLFLCYNRPLADFLAERASGFTVKNFHALCRDLATAAGIPWAPPKDRDALREYMETEPPQQLIEALDAYPDERFDAVIVDEGQDFREYWWVAVEKLLRDRKDILWIFFDPLQDLYGGGPTEALGLMSASLTWNCRNTGRIAIFASSFVGTQPKLKPDAPEGVAVEEIPCPNDAAMVDRVRKCLHRLVAEEKIATDRIVILSPRSAQASPVWRKRRLGNFTLIEFPHRPGPNEVTFSTLQRFKGLEADVIILCDVAEGDPTCSSHHLYVGTSRARHVLVVMSR